MHQQMGKLYVVATPIGNLNDISHRAIETLKQVAWIAAEDTRHSQGLLSHLGISTKLLSYHEHNEADRTPVLIEKLKEGEIGALISDAGTPLISDPGFRLVAAAHQSGIPVVPIPGPCALVTALSASGLPTDQFLFEGFLPAKSQARRKRLETLLESTHTTVFYEAPHRILDFIEDCVSVLGPERQIAIARELTKKFESIILSNSKEIFERLAAGSIPQKGEFVVVIAPASQIESDISAQEQEIQRILKVLLAEVSLKQAVQIAVKLTDQPKNKVYDLATKLQKS